MSKSSLFGACIIISWLSLSLTNIPPKEHKVHNIVLYPEKNSWCEVTPIKQVISHAGCHSKSVDNNVCVGACFSFSVPRTIPETPGDDQLHYCDSCQASESTWIKVSLECSEDNNSHKIEKRVEIIGNCSCMFCKEKQGYTPSTQEDDNDNDYDYDVGLKQLYDSMKKAPDTSNPNSVMSATPTNDVATDNEPPRPLLRHRKNNPQLHLLQEDHDEDSESEIDEEVLQHIKALEEQRS